MSETFTKNDVTLGEYNMHNYVLHRLTRYFLVPSIVSYDRESKTLVMERISGMSIADFYGEDIATVPAHVLKKCRNIIATLWDYDIVYPDITGYNFIQDDDGFIWLIDFEHAYFFFDGDGDPFVRAFIGGLISWNPDFA